MSYHGGAPRVRRRQTGATADDGNSTTLWVDNEQLVNIAVNAAVTAAVTAAVSGYVNKNL